MNFSEKTQLNKIMSKSNFLKMVNLNTVAKNEFNAKVERLYLANILRKDTINIEPGNKIKEINILEIHIKDKYISDNLIKCIDSALPRYLVYCLRYQEEAQLIISFKEKNNKSGKYSVVQLYKTNWEKYENLKLDINGLNLDTVYENFIVQIANGKIDVKYDLSVKDAVIKSIDIEKLNKKLIQLEKKIHNEKQYNKQLELKKELKLLKLQLEVNNG